MLHADLTGGKRKRPSIVTRCFQGELEVTTLAGTGAPRQTFVNTFIAVAVEGVRLPALASVECDDVVQQQLQIAVEIAFLAA